MKKLIITIFLMFIAMPLVLGAAGDPTCFLNSTFGKTACIGGNAGIGNFTGNIYGQNGTLYNLNVTNNAYIGTTFSSTFYLTSITDTYLLALNAGPFVYATWVVNNTDAIHITPATHYVGIYDDNPSYTLDVGGNISGDVIYEKGNTINSLYNDSARINSLNSTKNQNGTQINQTFIYTNGLNSTGDIRLDLNSYLYGQPILGMLGSGMIKNSGTATGSELNVTCVGLNCSYKDFTVRLITGTGTQFAVNCAIPAGNFTAVDNQHSVRYIDQSCAINVATIESFFNDILTQGGVWDFSNIMCHHGTCEVVNGIGLENRRMMKQRVIDYHTDHLRVVSGLGFTAGTWPNYTVESGEYIYLMDTVNTPALNTTSNNVEYFYHNGSTNYSYVDINGVDLARCDNGTALVTCTGVNFRRYFIYVVGWNETGHTPAELIQTAGLLGTTYANAAACLDTTTNPLVYNLPNYYTKAAVPLWAYCSQRTSTSWTTANLIDLRAVKTGSSSGTALETDPVWTVASVNYNTISVDWLNDTGSFATIATAAALNSSKQNNLSLVNDTNIAASLSPTGTLTLIWLGTLADARITSAATWNAKINATQLANTTIIRSFTAFGGDVSGHYDDVVVTDDSHAHTKSTVTIDGANVSSGTVAAARIDSALARLSGPTFTGTVTIPSPFTLGATSMTATGTQLNYLASATGTTGTATTNVVFSASPTFTGLVTGAGMTLSAGLNVTGGSVLNITTGSMVAQAANYTGNSTCALIKGATSTLAVC